jgi:hypothetical protein
LSQTICQSLRSSSKVTDRFAQTLGHLWQLAGAEDDQSDDQDEQQLARANVEEVHLSPWQD